VSTSSISSCSSYTPAVFSAYILNSTLATPAFPTTRPQAFRRRNKQAAKKFFCQLLKGLQYVPRVISTEKLKSYGAAKREILPRVEHRQSRYLNNRFESWAEIIGTERVA
jgi:hypothetical protein